MRVDRRRGGAGSGGVGGGLVRLGGEAGGNPMGVRHAVWLGPGLGEVVEA